MFLTGRIWFIVMAATVMVFVQFASVAAEAHVGHARGIEKPTATVANHSVSGSIRLVDSIVNHATGAKTKVPATVAHPHHVSAGQTSHVSGQQLLNKINDPHGCATGCCSDCLMCFGFAFNEGPHDLAPVKRSIRVRLASPLSASAIKPEALRKPPRDFV